MRNRDDEDDEDEFDPDKLEIIHGAVASNPARVRLTVWHFVTCQPVTVIAICLVSAAVVVPLAVFASKWCWFLFLLTAALLVMYYLGTAKNFWYGDVCPAVVLSRNPDKFAVYTDMTKGWVSHPAIVIQGGSVFMLEGLPVEEGDRIATANLYRDTDEELPDERWGGLHTGVILAATTDEKAIRRTFKSIDAEEWNELDRGLKRLPRSLKPGVYFLNELADRPPPKPRRAKPILDDEDDEDDEDDDRPQRHRRRRD
ncbi:DUF3239 domain-containing protein [Fimbriiglobus ruber]|uniref:Ankyrin repeats containing protein n=1 Tax=Fimbriiglobus ruber TaxID=1908690 RepID=A0A225DMA5_9BACT|nr:DUF3239 domain-containing protein [Fimbriiglobus ruber]OWK39678.1 Ankyrin repeats containing protein [Fimbriiglobus ruber]